MNNATILISCTGLFGVGLWAVWKAWKNLSRRQQLEARGVRIPATVTVRRASGGPPYRGFYVSYHAEIKNADGTTAQTINKSDIVSYSSYLSLAENNTVIVAYLSEDPSGTAQLAHDYGGKSGWGVVMAGVLVWFWP